MSNMRYTKDSRTCRGAFGALRSAKRETTTGRCGNNVDYVKHGLLPTVDEFGHGSRPLHSTLHSIEPALSQRDYDLRQAARRSSRSIWSLRHKDWSFAHTMLLVRFQIWPLKLYELVKRQVALCATAQGTVVCL